MTNDLTRQRTPDVPGATGSLRTPPEGSAHTPTPWELSTLSGRIPAIRERKMPHGEASTYTATIVRADRPTEHVVRLDFGYGRKGLDDANAAFIVRACNSHEELLAALKAVEAHHAAINAKAGCDESRSKTLGIVRAAIAKATSDNPPHPPDGDK